ncbi:DUF1054 domain-containing protein [Bacillus carboniphilus]|uniref:UPF0637 protein LC087_03680 n=1 Tax=Bacillus carboniphilus TaxID=86663 RepID=A0ABY9JV71_9BACI|nr:DUF1054 domain-containing protein [Bacillus carboniphilus]WLR43301.1 DUF1054 domain-containing protein [Bacillus carboniphilus]
MKFEGFTKEDFDTFTVDGLDERMQLIKDRIQPKFSLIGEELCEDLSAALGNEMYLHIAKHARRTKNPPKDTWLAICENKRGYKQHPHFQIGLWDDHLFIWLAYIYEAPNKQQIGKTFLDDFSLLLETIPTDYKISKDHTKNQALTMTEENLKQTLTRFYEVKKGEFLVGRQIQAGDPILEDGKALINIAKETFHTLLPIYKLSLIY